jgi:hypothetical protein
MGWREDRHWTALVPRGHPEDMTTDPASLISRSGRRLRPGCRPAHDAARSGHGGRARQRSERRTAGRSTVGFRGGSRSSVLARRGKIRCRRRPARIGRAVFHLPDRVHRLPAVAGVPGDPRCGATQPRRRRGRGCSAWAAVPPAVGIPSRLRDRGAQPEARRVLRRIPAAVRAVPGRQVF